ncbi:MAG: ABC transporter permease [Flavobacteriales bacterium]
MRIEVDATKWRWLPDLRELIAQRDLFLVLARRDIRVRYAQTMLGLAWAFLQPLATLVVLTLIFGHAVHVDTGGVPYPLFAVTGISVWSYFAFVMKEAGGSVIGAQEVIRKIYFPRLIIPLSKAAVGLMDLLVALLLMIGLFIYYRQAPHAGALLALAYLVAIIFTALGAGIWVSALTIRFRDLQHVVPFVIQFGLFITPIAYPADAITATLPGWARVLYFLNPMAGLVEGYRWALLGVGGPGGWCLLSFFSAAVIFVTGLLYFRSMERLVADLI